jgi:hypothetical protein
MHDEVDESGTPSPLAASVIGLDSRCPVCGAFLYVVADQVEWPRIRCWPMQLSHPDRADCLRVVSGIEAQPVIVYDLRASDKPLDPVHLPDLNPGDSLEIRRTSIDLMFPPKEG